MRETSNSDGFSLNVPEKLMILETTARDFPQLANAAISTACAIWHDAPQKVRATFHNLYPEAARFLEAADKVLTNVPLAAPVPTETYDDIAQGCLNIALLGLLCTPPEWTRRVLAAYPILKGPLNTFRKGHEELIANDKETK